MSQSLSCIYVHVVFSTKNRAALISSEIELKLHAYLATLARNQGWECIKVGGLFDHVHLALRQPRTGQLSDLIGHIKRNSTKWMKENHQHNFSWQRGYGAFSVSPNNLEVLLNYIVNQKEHHKQLSFKEEYLKFLNQYRIAYDEKYMWD